jgi:molybdopterin-containing oxidoreductase family iron-sulfur binding subunit
MSINRRQFLKIAGASTLVGLGGTTVINGLSRTGLQAAQISPPAEALKAKRWGMVIDMSKVQSDAAYKKIIDSCHSIHNVPSDFPDPKHEIKWIWTDSFGHTFPGQEDEYLAAAVEHKPFFMLCNHCQHPPCVRVCPTKATFKRSDGVVMMDMHRCIGCRFCMAACPYGARSFNWRDPRPFIRKENPDYPTRMKGVVEKCTFCTERLAQGLLPACAEASDGAIVFGDLGDPHSEIREILHSKYAIRRKPEVGTHPSVYYVIGGGEHA